MKISIPFGRGMQEALIPDEVLQAVLTPAAGSDSDIPFETQQDTVQEALAILSVRNPWRRWRPARIAS